MWKLLLNNAFRFNPRTPKVKIHLRTPKGGWVPPLHWILVFPCEFFENITYGYVFGVKESNGDNEKILSLLLDLEIQGQTPFWMTFVISGCKRGTDLILVSILTFLGSRRSKKLKSIFWPWRLTLKIKVIYMYRYDLCYLLQETWYQLDHVIYFGLFEIPDLEYVGINTKIKSVACIQPEIQEVT